MSDNKMFDDEDYLDSLLKSVEAGDNMSSTEDDIENELDFEKSIDWDFAEEMSEDDFLNNFENDILMNDDAPSPSKDNDDYMSIEEMFNDNNAFANDIDEKIISVSDTSNSIGAVDTPDVFGDAGVSNETDAFGDAGVSNETDAFGDAGVSNEADVFGNAEVSSEADVFGNAEVSSEEDVFGNVKIPNDVDTFSDNDAMNKEKVKESFDNINNIDEDLINSFEGLFAANQVDDSVQDNDFDVNKSANARPEEDINNLMDILGAFGDSEGLSEEDEIEVENKGGKWKKKKKKKDKKAKKDKKSFFKKKKDNKEESFDNVANSSGELESSGFENAFGMSATDDSSNQQQQQEDDFGFGFNFDEIGFSSTEDIFADSNSSDSNSNNNESEEKKSSGGRSNRELDDEDEEDEEDDKKKKKKEKKKKEKKPKQKKEKEKKEKVRDKELDEVIHMSKGVAFILLSFVVMLVIFLIYGGNLYQYNKKMQHATNMYVEKKYSEAYDTLWGIEIKEDDMSFYNQIITVMYVMRYYEAGCSHVELKDYAQGLDSLIKGIKAYDKNQNNAREYKCFDDMTVVLGWINDELKEVYGLTESEARELSLIDDKYEYAFKVRTIANEVEKRMEEQENDSNN